jgi:hypothetical protein
MKISRKNLNRLIESLLIEDRLPSAELGADQLGDYEMQGATKLGDASEQEISNAELNLMNQAMEEYIQNSNSKSLGGLLDDLVNTGMAGTSALVMLMSTPMGAPAAMAALPVGMAGLSGAMMGNFVDELFRADNTTFRSKTLRRAAQAAGLGEDIGRYSHPSVEDIKATGFEGLKPRDVDPVFKRKLAFMHILSGNIKRESDKPYIIKDYEQLVDEGIIDGDAFGAIADEVSKDFTGAINQAASEK